MKAWRGETHRSPAATQPQPLGPHSCPWRSCPGTQAPSPTSGPSVLREDKDEEPGLSLSDPGLQGHGVGAAGCDPSTGLGSVRVCVRSFGFLGGQGLSWSALDPPPALLAHECVLSTLSHAGLCKDPHDPEYPLSLGTWAELGEGGRRPLGLTGTSRGSLDATCSLVRDVDSGLCSALVGALHCLLLPWAQVPGHYYVLFLGPRHAKEPLGRTRLRAVGSPRRASSVGWGSPVPLPTRASCAPGAATTLPPGPSAAVPHRSPGVQQRAGARSWVGSPDVQTVLLSCSFPPATPYYSNCHPSPPTSSPLIP